MNCSWFWDFFVRLREVYKTSGFYIDMFHCHNFHVIGALCCDIRLIVLKFSSHRYSDCCSKVEMRHYAMHTVFSELIFTFYISIIPLLYTLYTLGYYHINQYTWKLLLNTLQQPGFSGEQFMVGPEICGARLSVRHNEAILSLWNRNAQDQKTCYRCVLFSDLRPRRSG